MYIYLFYICIVYLCPGDLSSGSTESSGSSGNRVWPSRTVPGFPMLGIRMTLFCFSCFALHLDTAPHNHIKHELEAWMLNRYLYTLENKGTRDFSSQLFIRHRKKKKSRMTVVSTNAFTLASSSSLPCALSQQWRRRVWHHYKYSKEMENETTVIILR